MYEQIAEYYDLTHANLTVDMPLVLQLAAQAGGPVLELGCGSGRLLLPLAKAGHTVTGVDNSPAMLARAQARLALEPPTVAQRVTLVTGDMTALDGTLPEGNGRFALIIVPYNTLMHLTEGDVRKMLRQVKGLLAGNGRLFIDLANPFVLAATPGDQLLSLENSLIDPQTGDVIVHMASNRLDEKAQTLQITWIYDRSPAAGGSVHRTVAWGAYHYYFPHQVELLLKQAGLWMTQLWGSYGREPFEEDSERLLVTAVKT